MELFSPSARGDEKALRRAYLRLALAHHPDKQPPGSREAATVRFQEIQEAYEKLSAAFREGAPAPGRVKTVLAAACELGDVEEVRRLLREQPESVHHTDELGALPLMFAAKGGSVEVCQLLLDARAEADAMNPIGWTALTWASLSDQVDVMSLLLEKGAVVSDKVLILVAWTGHSPAMRRLLAAAPAEQVTGLLTDESRQGLLHLAVGGLAYEKSAVQEHIRTLELLLGARCDLEGVEGRSGRTVLQKYVGDRHWETDDLENKPLHLQTVRRLLAAGASPWAKGPCGESAVDIAERRGLWRVLALLRAADPGARDAAEAAAPPVAVAASGPAAAWRWLAASAALFCTSSWCPPLGATKVP